MTSKLSPSCWLSKTMKEDPIWERQCLNELNGNQNPCVTYGGYQIETSPNW